MLIIPNDILFKYATANNVQYGSNMDHQMEVIDLIGLITFTDFNRLAIDL